MKVIVERPTVIIDVDIACYLSIYFLPPFLSRSRYIVSNLLLAQAAFFLALFPPFRTLSTARMLVSFSHLRRDVISSNHTHDSEQI